MVPAEEWGIKTSAGLRGRARSEGACPLRSQDSFSSDGNTTKVG